MKSLVIKVAALAVGAAGAEIVRPGSVSSMMAGAVKGLGAAASAF